MVSLRFFAWLAFVLIAVWACCPDAMAKGRRGGGCSDGSCFGGTCTQADTAKMWLFDKPDAKPTKPTIVIEVPATLPDAVIMPDVALPSTYGAATATACNCRRPIRHAIGNVLRFAGKAAKGTVKAAAVIIGHERRAARRVGRRCGDAIKQ